ncbi:MAG: hypothetical protein RLZZ546_2164 [Bacteroidota bacterium]|jgi:hypothetical protein
MIIDKEFLFWAIVVFLFIGGMFALPFIALDWHTGEHGRLTITAVDKNLFGTYTVYSRNSDSAIQEITYCIDADNQELAKLAKEKIGTQNTTLVYPDRRIGLYWFNKCTTAPIKEIKNNE